MSSAAGILHKGILWLLYMASRLLLIILLRETTSKTDSERYIASRIIQEVDR